MIVTRNKAGELRAFHNVCRHRPPSSWTKAPTTCGPTGSGVPTTPGPTTSTEIVSAPRFFEGSDIPEDMQAVFDTENVKGFDKADYGLIPVQVDSWGFLVFVNLDPAAGPLTEQLGDLPERFSGYRLDEWQVTRTKNYEVKRQLQADRRELHGVVIICHGVHPELVKVSKMEDHYRWQGPGLYTGMLHHARFAEHGGRRLGRPPAYSRAR